VKDARQTFVGIWIRCLLEGKPFEVWGGEQLRDFNYVDDVVDAFLMAAQDDRADGQVFNLGSDEVVSHSRRLQTFCYRLALVLANLISGSSPLNERRLILVTIIRISL